ncbi:hypothetical protein RhiirA5_367510 [Rhizophagus irregularis]|uniref:Uncharacterized protein n=1 Tax=Rhizophagus irregularis TaxID=588596 RepID=A0A2N0NRL9_9GLOM|nr:hypothetical protein RhiirA5_367510 [Rhizophagus irregularis]
MPVPERHPKSETRDDQQDYIDLINKLQKDTRCSSGHHLRINKEGKQFCRFKYSRSKSCYYIASQNRISLPKRPVIFFLESSLPLANSSS